MTSIRIAISEFAKKHGEKSTVLDVGCGLRPYEEYFRDGKYIGIDVPQSGREAGGKKPDFEFDGTNIPFEDDKFDAVLCTEVLEHAVDPAVLLREIQRVMKSDAELFLTVPFMWGMHEVPYDFRRFTTEGIKKEIEKSGLKVTYQAQLDEGVDAIRMLIESETNNFLRNRIDPVVSRSFKFKMINYWQGKLLRLLLAIWRRNYKFERIYIDNLVVAKKLKNI